MSNLTAVCIYCSSPCKEDAPSLHLCERCEWFEGEKEKFYQDRHESTAPLSSDEEAYQQRLEDYRQDQFESSGEDDGDCPGCGAAPTVFCVCLDLAAAAADRGQ